MNAVKALIFGGTSEGRELAEFAAEHQVFVLVSVVSEYGESLLTENTYVRVRQGAQNPEAMEALLLKEAPELVLDATHPYAKVVTDQVRALCGKLEIPYQRVVREAPSAVYGSGDCGTLAAGDGVHSAAGNGPEIFSVSSSVAAADLLAADRKPVLLTTGSKELEVFAGAAHLSGRIFARVLPDSGVLEKCEKLGISGAHLIAMQGPFSREMNRAILHSTGAKWLVTKESGDRGGFLQKVQAAGDCGCRVIVIKRPVKEEGISLAEAKKLLKPDRTGCQERTAARTLSLIGMGMGGGRQLTLEAVDALKKCDALLGAPRMLEDAGVWYTGAKKEPLYAADRILEWLEAHPECRNAAVVYSGDTGFYSGCSSLVDALQKCFGAGAPRADGDGAENDRAAADWQVRVYPGISSVSGLCARMQVTWEDLYLASAHGRSCDVVALVRQHPRLFLLLGGAENLGGVCRKLKDAGYGDVRVTAGVRMGYPDERLLTGTAAELCGAAADELSAAVFQRKMRTGMEPEGES